MRIWIFLLAIFIYVPSVACQDCHSNFILNGFGVQQSLSQHVSFVFEHIGIQQCSRECLLRTKCKAVAYNRRSFKCYISENDTYITTSSNQEDIASSRTTLMQFETQLLKSCAGHVCDESSVCVEMSNGISRCVSWTIPHITDSGSDGIIHENISEGTTISTTLKITELSSTEVTTQGQSPNECDDPPTVEGADVPNSTDRSFGTVLIYSCHPGLVVKGETETTCQSDGQWSTLSMICTNCDTTYFVFNQSLNFCYRIEDSVRNTYADANLHCNTMGGKLAKVDSTEKISELLLNLYVQAYVDGTDVAVDGTWVYSDGTMVNIDLFKLGAPSPGDTNCLSLRSDIGKMLDISCDLKKFSICEQT